MMLRYSLGEPAAADAIETAVKSVIDQGLRTGDIYSEGLNASAPARWAKR
jgi:3-isopropylmalate dehydrogenase